MSAPYDPRDDRGAGARYQPYPSRDERYGGRSPGRCVGAISSLPAYAAPVLPTCTLTDSWTAAFPPVICCPRARAEARPDWNVAAPCLRAATVCLLTRTLVIRTLRAATRLLTTRAALRRLRRHTVPVRMEGGLRLDTLLWTSTFPADEPTRFPARGFSPPPPFLSKSCRPIGGSAVQNKERSPATVPQFPRSPRRERAVQSAPCQAPSPRLCSRSKGCDACALQAKRTKFPR